MSISEKCGKKISPPPNPLPPSGEGSDFEIGSNSREYPSLTQFFWARWTNRCQQPCGILRLCTGMWRLLSRSSKRARHLVHSDLHNQCRSYSTSHLLERALFRHHSTDRR